MLHKANQLAHKCKCTIVSTMVNKYQNPRWWKEEPFAHVHGDMRNRVAKMSLNRGHRNNVSLVATIIDAYSSHVLTNPKILGSSYANFIVVLRH
jgi:hypothetical protein